MAARLGDVLYWAFAALAALLVGLGGFLAFAEPRNAAALFSICAVAAVAVWLTGRACRYVLAAR